MLKYVLLAVMLLILLCAMRTLSDVWVGHIPRRYHYNPELPKASNIMSWTNMNSSVVQNALRRNIAAETEKLKSSKAPEGFSVVEYEVQEGQKNIPLYCIQTDDLPADKKVPAVLYIHGGAFYYPLSEQGLYSMAYYAKELGARIFCPDYRSSLENPFPIPLMDCYHAALYLEKNAEELNIDMERFLLYGDSAGGCLAAGLVQYIRDFGGPRICGQMLVYPVMDNSMKYASMEKYADAVWSLNANEHMWKVYLRDGHHGQLKYAAPMQSDDFSNLPRAYIEPAEMDILCDEGIAYAGKLEEVGVPVEMYVTPGGYHGFDAVQNNVFVRSMLEKRVSVMKNMVKKS